MFEETILPCLTAFASLAPSRAAAKAGIEYRCPQVYLGSVPSEARSMYTAGFPCPLTALHMPIIEPITTIYCKQRNVMYRVLWYQQADTPTPNAGLAVHSEQGGAPAAQVQARHPCCVQTPPQATC